MFVLINVFTNYFGIHSLLMTLEQKKTKSMKENQQVEYLVNYFKLLFYYDFMGLRKCRGNKYYCEIHIHFSMYSTQIEIVTSIYTKSITNILFTL